MKIKELRKSMKLTQHQFASAIGTTQNHISEWENGVVIPSISTIRAINEMFKQDLRHIDFLQNS